MCIILCVLLLLHVLLYREIFATAPLYVHACLLPNRKGDEPNAML